MNKRSRKTKGLSRRLIAWLLCCVCLLGAAPISAIALEADATPVVEETATIEPTEEVTVVLEATAAPTPTALSDSEDTSVDVSGSEAETTAEPADTVTPENTVTEEPTSTIAPASEDTSNDASSSETENTPESETAIQPENTSEPEATPTVEATATDVPAESTEPPAPTEEVQPEQNAADALYERLMACTTYEEMAAILNALTEEELLLINQFTDEQAANVQLKMDELSGSPAEILQDRDYTIAQGGTQTVTVSSMSSSDFSYSCEQSGITASRSNNGYTISVGSSVPAGIYTLTVNYKTTSSGSWWGGSSTTTENTDTVTITVTRSGNYLTVTNTMTNVDVVYFKVENGQITESLVPVSNGQSVETLLPTTNDAIIFFVKPKDGYLLTKFYRSDGTDTDLYSTDTTAANSNIGLFKNNNTLGDNILTQARNAGYIGYYGFTGVLNQAYSAPFVEVAEAPQMSISATASPNTDLKPGDQVTFTVTVTPGDLSTGADYTITDKKLTSLTINGVSYPATQNEDGTYSVDYTITEADWSAGHATLNATASLTYNYVVPVKDRVGATGNIRTTETITSSATTDCTFATKQGVVYAVTFDPADKADITKFPTTPVDSNTYFEGSTVTVDKDYDRTPVDDPVNKGTWTFDGWYHGEEKVGETLTMGTSSILLTGKWTFTPYPNADLTIKKTVSGNMQDSNKEFTFTITADKAMTYNGEEKTSFTFNLKKNEEVTISVPVGATVTVSEDADGYAYSIGSETTITGYTDLESGNGISFTMPNDASKVVFNNAKDITVDTGVILDTLPYVLILAVVVIGVVVLIKRRRNRDDD